jgi:prepilin-type N-terminal cleavage/methylation domain-containing protein
VRDPNMIFRRNRQNKYQKGFTLIETLIVVAISSIVAVIITSSISQLIMVNSSNKNHMEAIKQVENALHYINRDVQVAQTIILSTKQSDGSYKQNTTQNFTFDLTQGDNLTLNWVEWSDDKTTIEYTLDTDKDILYKKTTLKNYLNPDKITDSALARYITEAKGSWDVNDEGYWVFTLNLTATIGQKSETRILNTIPRPSH